MILLANVKLVNCENVLIGYRFHNKYSKKILIPIYPQPVLLSLAINQIG